MYTLLLLLAVNIVDSCTYDVIWEAQPPGLCRLDYEPFPRAGVCLEALRALDSDETPTAVATPTIVIYVLLKMCMIYYVGSLCVRMCK